MAIGPIPPINSAIRAVDAADAAGGAGRIGGAGGATGGSGLRVGDGPSFGDTLSNSLQSVSDAERHVDTVAQEIATGGPAEIHELMASTAKASLSVDLLVQVRNRAVEAYQEIMRMQV